MGRNILVVEDDRNICDLIHMYLVKEGFDVRIAGDGGKATPDYMRPWTFTSDDGRFEMDYTPVLDRASCSDVGLIKSDQHQVFGVFNGRAVLDDGTVLNVKDLPGFAEKVINKW